jgi:hypothetical protein
MGGIGEIQAKAGPNEPDESRPSGLMYSILRAGSQGTQAGRQAGRQAGSPSLQSPMHGPVTSACSMLAPMLRCSVNSSQTALSSLAIACRYYGAKY